MLHRVPNLVSKKSARCSGSGPRTIIERRDQAFGKIFSWLAPVFRYLPASGRTERAYFRAHLARNPRFPRSVSRAAH